MFCLIFKKVVARILPSKPPKTGEDSPTLPCPTLFLPSGMGEQHLLPTEKARDALKNVTLNTIFQFLQKGSQKSQEKRKRKKAWKS